MKVRLRAVVQRGKSALTVPMRENRSQAVLGDIPGVCGVPMDEEWKACLDLNLRSAGAKPTVPHPHPPDASPPKLSSVLHSVAKGSLQINECGNLDLGCYGMGEGQCNHLFIIKEERIQEDGQSDRKR